MEYLRVLFPENREVLADDDEVGSTNSVIMLKHGEYEISLSGSGYTPVSRKIVLMGTTIKHPKQISFKVSSEG